MHVACSETWRTEMLRSSETWMQTPQIRKQKQTLFNNVRCKPRLLAPCLVSAAARGSTAPPDSKANRNATALQAAISATDARLRACIEAEAAEQRRQLESVYNRASDKGLAAKGLLLVDLRATQEGRLFSELVMKLAYPDGKGLPLHKFRQGTAAAIKLAAPSDASIDAVVLEVRQDALLVTISADAAEMISRRRPGSTVRLELGMQDTTARRQLAALAELSNAADNKTRGAQAVRAILLGAGRSVKLAAEPPSWMKCSQWRQDAALALEHLGGVNASQRGAVGAALSRTLTLWIGPPGTGKTRTVLAFLRTLCQLTSSSLQRQAELGQLLAVADTNAAADNLLEGMLASGINAVRIGQPAKVRPELRHSCLDARAEATQQGRQAASMRDHAATLLARAEKASQAGQITPQELAELQKEARRTWSQADAQMEAAIKAVLVSCPVLVGTCTASGDPRLRGQNFRVIVIDEATQATEASTLIPLVKGAECVIMAGDHKQLPPTVISNSALRRGFDVPLFQRLQQAGHPALLLNTQYRMHPAISAFPSKQFYNDRIACGVSAEDRRPIAHFPWPDSNRPVVFIDCDGPEQRGSIGKGFSEGMPGENGSYRNAEQGNLAMQTTMHFLNDNSVSVALLTPYSGQVRLLNEYLRREGADATDALQTGRLVVSTIDGFQGREAEAVVLSTVRCNSQGRLGFVADARRMNVALTRARRGLVVIGSATTLSSDPNWKAWLDAHY